MPPEPLWQKLIVAGMGPFVAALLALALASPVASIFQRRREHADVREALAAEITEAASGAYGAMQSFWRAARHVKVVDRQSSSEITSEREALEAAYNRAFVQSKIIERKLQIYFSSDEPRMAWHRLWDLLSTRYHLLLKSGDERLKVCRRNAGSQHSGLTSEQLNDPTALLAAIRAALTEPVDSLWRHPVDMRARHLKRRRLASLWSEAVGVPGTSTDES